MIDYEWTDTGLLPEDIARRALHCYGLENAKRMEHPIVKRAMERVGLDGRQGRSLANRRSPSREASCGKRTEKAARR